LKDHRVTQINPEKGSQKTVSLIMTTACTADKNVIVTDITHRNHKNSRISTYKITNMWKDFTVCSIIFNTTENR